MYSLFRDNTYILLVYFIFNRICRNLAMPFSIMVLSLNSRFILKVYNYHQFAIRADISREYLHCNETQINRFGCLVGLSTTSLTVFNVCFTRTVVLLQCISLSIK